MRTYVVRVQDSRTPDSGADALRGVAEEIATGRHLTFTCGAELLDLLAAPHPAADTDRLNAASHQGGPIHADD